jgi:hypothetical protein
MSKPVITKRQLKIDINQAMRNMGDIDEDAKVKDILKTIVKEPEGEVVAEDIPLSEIDKRMAVERGSKTQMRNDSIIKWHASGMTTGTITNMVRQLATERGWNPVTDTQVKTIVMNYYKERRLLMR